MNIKEFVKLFTPPIVVQGYRAMRSGWKRNAPLNQGLSFSGNYLSWDEALAASTGYDSKIILEKTRAALLQVKQGEAVYERDSVLSEIQYAWPLLAGILWVAAQSEGKLNVLDFGGSLGTTYFQNRIFLDQLKEVHWNIVEQPHYVQTGRNEFQDDRLKFFNNIKQLLSTTTPDAIILSGVLQYLENPYIVLDQMIQSSCKYLIIDRTPFWNGGEDRITVQKVPPTIYEASYPAWIFSLRKFKRFFSSCRIIAEFEGFAGGILDTDLKGFIIDVRKPGTKK